MMVRIFKLSNWPVLYCFVWYNTISVACYRMLISDFACKGMTKCEDKQMEWKLNNLHGHVKMMFVLVIAISSKIFKITALFVKSMLNWFIHLSDWCVVQIVALCSLSSVWVRRWVLRLLACLNDLLQSVQEWGFSPVCVIMCSLRCPAWLNVLLQLLHLCGFSPVWISKCFFKSPAWPNDLLHPEQLCIFTPVWMSIWFLR